MISRSHQSIKSPLFVQVRAEVNEKARDRDPNPEEPELADQQDSKGPMLKGIFSGMFQEAVKEVLKGIFRIKVLGF